MTNTKRLPRARGGEFQTVTTPRVIQRGNPQRSVPETEITAKIKPKTEINIEIIPKLPESGVQKSAILSSTQQDKIQNFAIQPKEAQKTLPKRSESRREITPDTAINREQRENIKPKTLSYRPAEHGETQIIRCSNPQRPRGATQGSTPSFQQIGEGILGTAQSIGSNFLDANRALYESGQVGRTGRYEEETKELLDGLKKAEYAMEILKQDNASLSEIQSQQNIINSYYQKLIAYSTVLNDNIQQLATQSTAWLSDQIERSAAQHIMSAKEGLNPSGQLAIDAVMMGTQFLGDMAVNTVIPGGGLLALGLDTFGSQTKEARQQGADLNTQLTAGVGSALLSMGLEELANMVPSLKRTYGSGVVDDFLEQLTQLQEDPVGQAFLAGFTEGGEEFIEALIQTALQKATYDPDARFSLENALRQALTGAAFGATVSSLDSLVSSAKKDGFLAGFYEKELQDISGNPTLLYESLVQAKEFSQHDPIVWNLVDAWDDGLHTYAELNDYYSQYLTSIGAQNTDLDTIDKYLEGKYSNSAEFNLLRGYSNAIKKGDISPLIGLDEYRKVDKQITDALVGLTTSTDVTIQGYATHFIDRVIGQTSTSHKGMRTGVSIEDVIDALQNPLEIDPIRVMADGDMRQQFFGKNASVTISISSNRLIQVNPYGG